MITFKEFLTERFISVGLNRNHDAFREMYRQDIINILRNSYKAIGGYSGLPSGSEQESSAINGDISNCLIKATTRGGKITAVVLYKDQRGRKIIAIGTDQTPQGKQDFLKIASEDSTMQRAWGEASGAVEHLLKKMKMPVIPASRAHELIGKPDIEIEPDSDYYTRKIGTDRHRKIMIGYPK